MNTLTGKDIYFDAKPPYHFETLNYITFAFEFGKTYVLDGWPWDGGETLSWIIGGLIEQTHGAILNNNSVYTLKNRQKDAWCVRQSVVKVRRFSFRDATVQDEIKHGLKAAADQYLKTEKEIIDRFGLTPERYIRPLRTLSHEAWRASCAIGLANSRKIFCFPYMRPDFINDNYDLWFKLTIDALREAGALVLVPTTALGVKNMQGLCDQVVPIKTRFE